MSTRKRCLVLAITGIDDTTGEDLGDGQIAVEFTGKINTWHCISIMRTGLLKALARDRDHHIITGKFLDIF